MVLADGRAVVEVVAAVAPQPPLDQVMGVKLALRGVLGSLLAEDAAVLVSLENCFAKLITREKLVVHLVL